MQDDLPVSEEESLLVGMLFEKITEIFPEWPMGDRTDLAMGLLVVVKKWAHEASLTTPAKIVPYGPSRI